MPLTDRDIKVGRTYRAKHPTKDIFGAVRNDRTVLHVSNDLRYVQYDSGTVGLGRHYPTVEMVKFLNWADREITDEDEDADRATENRRQPQPRRAAYRR